MMYCSLATAIPETETKKECLQETTSESVSGWLHYFLCDVRNRYFFHLITQSKEIVIMVAVAWW